MPAVPTPRRRLVQTLAVVLAGLLTAVITTAILVPLRGEAAAAKSRASIGTAAWTTEKTAKKKTNAKPTSVPKPSAPPATKPTTKPSSPPSTPPSSSPVPDDNPFGNRPFYVDPKTWASWAETQYPSAAPQIRRIARTAQARWIGEWTPTAEVAAQVDAYVGAATKAGASPVLALYAIPHRDCGSYSAGGFSSASAYGAWIGQVVKGIAHRPVAVIVEPDALTSADCLSAGAKQERMAMLKDAVDQLSSDPNTAVYIDSGHSRWLSAETLAARLKAVDVSRARGFSLNVSNFYTSAEQIAYGEKVSALLGGAHYVIDTSRNGNGPAPEAPLNWCNPSGRALGVAPTTKTAGAHADAYLWIKHPGESDGTCERNDPQSGTWFNDYAVGMVARSAA